MCYKSQVHTKTQSKTQNASQRIECFSKIPSAKAKRHVKPRKRPRKPPKTRHKTRKTRKPLEKLDQFHPRGVRLPFSRVFQSTKQNKYTHCFTRNQTASWQTTSWQTISWQTASWQTTWLTAYISHVFVFQKRIFNPFKQRLSRSLRSSNAYTVFALQIGSSSECFT